MRPFENKLSHPHQTVNQFPTKVMNFRHSIEKNTATLKKLSYSKRSFRVFPFLSVYFSCHKNTAALKNRSSRALTHTEITEIAEIDRNLNY